MRKKVSEQNDSGMSNVIFELNHLYKSWAGKKRLQMHNLEVLKLMTSVFSSQIKSKFHKTKANRRWVLLPKKQTNRLDTFCLVWAVQTGTEMTGVWFILTQITSLVLNILKGDSPFISVLKFFLSSYSA